MPSTQLWREAKTAVALICFTLIAGTSARAAHPLITDDTGTTGKGNFQLELDSQIATDEEKVEAAGNQSSGTDGQLSATGLHVESVNRRIRDAEADLVFCVGVAESVDLVLGLPLVWSWEEEKGGTATDQTGLSDASVEVKWRFLEVGGLSFALKPGLTLPSGDEDKGLGNGRLSGGVVLISTLEVEPFAVHANFGYLRNEYGLAEDREATRNDIWHVSLAAAYGAAERLTLVANVGAERSPDVSSSTPPAFILGGAIYGLTDDVEVDGGVKAGITRPEADWTGLFGLTCHF